MTPGAGMCRSRLLSTVESADALASPSPAVDIEALRQLTERLQREVHERAVHANALFSPEHWKHNAGEDWPHEPDDDSYTFFENCQHPDCRLVREALLSPSSKART